MAKLRPAKCYRAIKRPWTRRSKRKPRKSYIKGVPVMKIHRFEMGNKKKEFDKTYYLVSERPANIRSNALEASRVSCQKILQKEVGDEGYFMKVRVFPHHIMRENPIATGAGADRFQTGMRKAFGRPIGGAARVGKNQKVLEIRVDEGKEKAVRQAFKEAMAKLPATYTVQVA